MNPQEFISWMVEKGLISRVERQKCLNTFREEGIEEAKKEALQRIAENKPKPFSCQLTGIKI